jgi:hypothetical protein
MPNGLLEVFALLVVGHALADYPLQGEFLAKAKNRFARMPGTPWYQAMAAHAVIHGGAVFLATGSLLLGLTETVVHAFIDDAKCAGRISYNVDQALHIGCKIVWVLLLYTNVVQ